MEGINPGKIPHVALILQKACVILELSHSVESNMGELKMAITKKRNLRKKFRMMKHILIIAAILAAAAVVVLIALWALGHIAIVSRT